MKKNALIRIILWSVVLVILLAVFCGAMIGNFRGISFDAFEPMRDYRTGDGELSDGIRGIDLSWVAGEVSILVWEGEYRQA